MNILYIDDERNLAKATERLLSRRGHVMGWASGIDAAKPLLDAVDFIICDVMLDGETGVDFHRWLVANRPDQARRMVFVTGGYPRQTPLGRYLSECGVPILTKPFDVDALLELAGGMVGAAPA